MTDTHPSEEDDYDYSLSLVERVDTYLKSPHVIPKIRLIEGFEQDLVKEEAINQTFNLVVDSLLEISSLPNTSDNLKKVLFDNIPGIAQQIKRISENHTVIVEKLIPILESGFDDSNAEIKEAARDGLIKLFPLLTTNELKTVIYPVISNQTNVQGNDGQEKRIIAVKLLNEISKFIGADETILFCLPLIDTLSGDLYFRVRKSLAEWLDKIVEVLGPENNIPIFNKLGNDELWGVRSACAKSIVHISKYLTPEARKEFLLPLFNQFIVDKSRWVRSGACSSLGEFIATFPFNDVDNTLLQHFHTIGTSEDDASFGDTEFVEYCAFNFPAVLCTIGGTRWPELKELFLILSQSLQWKVRQSLSYSLFCIADLIGPHYTESDLLPCFINFLADLEEVKMGVVQNYAKFLVHLSEKERHKQLHILHGIDEIHVTWRYKKLIAKQLGDLANLFDSSIVSEEIVPIMFTLLTDQIAAVRKAIIPQVPQILKLLSERDNIFHKIEQYAEAKNWKNRLLFTKLSNILIEDFSESENFKSSILTPLIKLSQDVVVNVRIQVALCLCKIYKMETFRTNSEILQAINSLKLEKDRDIQRILEQI